MTNKTDGELERAAEEDFKDIIGRALVSKHNAAKVLDYHERSIRNFVNDGRLAGYHDKHGYHIETLSLVKFLYKKMSHLSPDLRSKIVSEIFKTHGLLRK